MSTGDQVQALSDQIDQVSSDLSNSVAAVQAELDQLAQANPQVDLSPVSDKLTQLDQAVQAVADLKPSTPA